MNVFAARRAPAARSGASRAARAAGGSVALCLCVATAFVGAQAATAAGILPPNNPPASIPPSPDFFSSCGGSGAVDDSQTCLVATMAALNNARAAEGVAAIRLPSNFLSLTPGEQLFVAIDAERVDRGEPPLAGMTSQLDQAALSGANADTDPSPPPGYPFTFFGSNWAGGVPSALGVDYLWMYDDGTNSPNLDCTSAGAPGCWGHRDNVLAALQCNPCTAGAAANSVATAYDPSLAAAIAGDVSGTAYTYAYSWATEQADLAPVPAVTSVSPPNGPPAGGTAITVDGSGFTDVSALYVGSTPVAYRVVSPTQITATVPSAAAGTTVNVRVTALGGESPVVSADRFSYGDVPGAPTGVVTLAGDGSLSVAWTPPVSNGGAAITSYRVVVSPGGATVTVAAPATFATISGLANGTAYTVTVRAVNAIGTGPVSAASVAATPDPGLPPGILALEPPSGPAPGGTPVTIVGANLSGVSAVSFGAVGATSFSQVSASVVTAVAPPSPSGTGAAVHVTVVAGGGTTAASAGSTFTWRSGDPYHALAPVRIADTRSYAGNPYQGAGRTLGPGGTLAVVVAGHAGSPVPAGASAVALQVTATDTTANGGYLTLWPADAVRPVASVENWNVGGTVADLVMVGVGDGIVAGQVDIGNGPGWADVIVDVEGYWGRNTSATSAGLYEPVAPQRIADTRSYAGNAYPDAGRTLVPGHETLALSVAGAGSVPASGAAAVMLNVTATGTTARSYLTAWPAGVAQPIASDVNWTGAGATVSSRVVAKVGTGGVVDIGNAAGSADVVVDVVGWFTDGSDPYSAGAPFNPVTPVRACDTRPGNATPCSGRSLGTAAPLAVTVAGVGSVPAAGGATPPSAVAAIVTATGTTAWSYLTVWAAGSPMPPSSDVNWTGAGMTVANLAAPALGGAGGIEVENAAGSTDVIVDVTGWFS